MKSNRQTRHTLGLDHKISNQRKIVAEGDKTDVVNNPTGRKRRTDDKQPFARLIEQRDKHYCNRSGVFACETPQPIHNTLYFARFPGGQATYDHKECQRRLFEKE